MADYIDFIEMTSKKPELGSEFIETLKTASAAELSSWFNEKGYNTPLEECVKIMENTKVKKGYSFQYVPMDGY